MKKYKGKTKEGKWTYGYFFKSWERTYILWGTTNGIPDMVEVIPSTVGQETGLKDKNGKKSYSGDKLLASDGDIGVIYWKENIAGFYCKWGDGSDMPLNTGVAVDKCEIIGNIHENSKLLEKNNGPD